MEIWGTHRTHNVISALNDDTRNMSAAKRMSQRSVSKTSASESHNIHLINLLFLQKLPFAHEPLNLNPLASKVPSRAHLNTYVINKIVVLYLGERAVGDVVSTLIL